MPEMYIRLYVHQGYALFIGFLYVVVSMWMYHHAMLNYINKYEILRSGFAAFVCVLMSVPVNVSCTSLSLLNAQRGAGKIQAESHFPSWLIGLVRKPAVRETAWGQCTALSIYCSSHDYSLCTWRDTQWYTAVLKNIQSSWTQAHIVAKKKKAYSCLTFGILYRGIMLNRDCSLHVICCLCTYNKQKAANNVMSRWCAICMC